VHLRPPAVSRAKNLGVAKGRSVYTLPVSWPPVFLPLRDRSVTPPVFHVSSTFIHPHTGTRKRSVSPLFQVALRLYRYFRCSDAMRRDPSVNDAPSPAIKTSARTTPPHLNRPSSYLDPRPAESWLGEPHCRGILSSRITARLPPPAPVKVPHLLIPSPP
jgi:hypothetical protein